VPLSNITVRAGDYEHVLQRLDSGRSTSLTLTPKDNSTLSVTYLLDQQVITVDGGPISTEGDDRTLTILADGHTAILTYGSANASVNSAPTRIEAQPSTPATVYPEPYSSDSR
jgi:hypothetical protein